MSFDRCRAQTLCESFFGCRDFAQFFIINYSAIEGYSLDKANAYNLSNSLKQDAIDLYFKGCQSLTESLINFNNHLYSWAIVKAYYATFYMVKADFALKDFALIRHKCIYYVQAREGATFLTKGRNSQNRPDYSGDHKSALNYYRELFSNSDILLTQEIEGTNCYNWLMKKREQINYQERDFKEPNRPDFLDFIDKRISNDGLLKLINEIIEDKYLLTFQPEYAALSIPYKRALLTKKSFEDNGIVDILSDTQITHLDKFAPFRFR